LIVLVRSNDINPDPRLQKYIDFLERKNEKYLVLGWNREANIIEKQNHKYFHLKANYGTKYLNIFNKLRWFIFIILYLIKNQKKYQIVHACDFDTALPVYLAKTFTKKKMIFDVFDWMSDKSKKNTVYMIIGILERRVFVKADYAIICEVERMKQIEIDKKNVLVMPNIPTIDFMSNFNIKNIIIEQRKSYDLILSYVGVFDSDRGLNELLEVVSQNKKIFLNIAGFGRFEDEVKGFLTNNSNIKLWGKVDYNTGINIMGNSDLIIAMYYKTNALHKYAAPNKYYEGLFLGIPIVTTEKTLVGEKTVKFNTGFAIGEGKEHLERLLMSLNIKHLAKEKAINANILWLETYKNYIEVFMETKYYPIVKDQKNSCSTTNISKVQ